MFIYSVLEGMTILALFLIAVSVACNFLRSCAFRLLDILRRINFFKFRPHNLNTPTLRLGLKCLIQVGINLSSFTIGRFECQGTNDVSQCGPGNIVL